MNSILNSAEETPKLHRVYKSTVPFTQYPLKNGNMCKFINYMFHTDDKEIQDELDKEIGAIGVGKSKHPVIYIDEKQVEINPEDLDPMVVLEKKMRAKILKEMQDATAITNDRGDTKQDFIKSVNNTVENTAKVSQDAGTLDALGKLRAAQAAAGQPVVSAGAQVNKPAQPAA